MKYNILTYLGGHNGVVACDCKRLWVVGSSRKWNINIIKKGNICYMDNKVHTKIHICIYIYTGLIGCLSLAHTPPPAANARKL